MGMLWRELEEIVDATVRSLVEDELFSLFLKPKDDEKSRVRRAYEYFLKQTYTYVANYHSFMLAAEQTFALHAEPFYRDLVTARVENNAREDARHETWLVNDYVAMGNLPEDILDAKPNGAVVAFNAYVAFIANSQKEVAAKFGVTAVLDGVALRLGRPMAETIKPLFGKDTVSFIGRLGSVDKRHVESLVQICDLIEGKKENRSAPDIDADRHRILLAASVVSQLYRNLMNPCKL